MEGYFVADEKLVFVGGRGIGIAVFVDCELGGNEFGHDFFRCLFDAVDSASRAVRKRQRVIVGVIDNLGGDFEIVGFSCHGHSVLAEVS